MLVVVGGLVVVVLLAIAEVLVVVLGGGIRAVVLAWPAPSHEVPNIARVSDAMASNHRGLGETPSEVTLRIRRASSGA